MPSFDIVSEVNLQEVKNAVDQAQREVTTRYDLKDAKISIELTDTLIVVVAPDDLKLKAVEEILRQKLAKRGVSLKSVEFKTATKAGGDTLRQEIHVKQGLTSEELKRLSKEVRDQKFKVTAQIQGDQLRVSGKKRDDLQAVIGHMRGAIKDLELQFINFRD